MVPWKVEDKFNRQIWWAISDHLIYVTLFTQQHLHFLQAQVTAVNIVMAMNTYSRIRSASLASSSPRCVLGSGQQREEKHLLRATSLMSTRSRFVTVTGTLSSARKLQRFRTKVDKLDYNHMIHYFNVLNRRKHLHWPSSFIWILGFCESLRIPERCWRGIACWSNNLWLRIYHVKVEPWRKKCYSRAS
jgi:hypothetical protein